MHLPTLIHSVQAAAPAVPATSQFVGTVKGTTGFAANIGAFLSTALSLIVAIAALIAFFFLIMGGIDWVTSGGDKNKTESARNKIMAAVIGLVVLAASYALLMIVLKILGLSNLTDILNNITVIKSP